MKRWLLAFIFVFICSPAWATNYCDDANAIVGLLFNVEEDPQTDCSGEGNTAAAVNDPAFQSSGCKFDGCYDYDGGNDGHIIEGGGGEFDSATGAGQARAWLYWINTDVALTNDLITDKSGFVGKHFWSEGQTSGSDTRIDGATDTSAPLSSTTAIVNGTWYHIAFKYDGTNQSLLVDGSTEDGPQLGSPAGDDTADLQIASNAGNNSADVQLDELVIFSRSPSDAEINDIIDNGLEGAAPAAGQVILI